MLAPAISYAEQGFPVGEVVSERSEPWQDGDTLIVPIYEEQLVVTKRLVLKEQLRVRRVSTTRHELFEDTLRKERLDVDDAEAVGKVHERYPKDEDDGEGRGLSGLVRKALS